MVLFITIFSLSNYAFGTIQDVPQKVKDAFVKKFPTVKVMEWSKEYETEWEVEFDMNGIEYSANFLEDGTWMETEHEIRRRDIPKNIRTVLKSEFPRYKIEEAEISETEKGMVYEFAIEKDKSEIEVSIDSSGKVVKKEAEENSEDNDDDN